MFLHQTLSTPCLDAVVCAEGAWLTTAGGRRVLDFHGNGVHQLGHGHPEVVAAVEAQLDALPFCPRRYTCEPAMRLAETLAARAPDPLGKVPSRRAARRRSAWRSGWLATPRGGTRRSRCGRLPRREPRRDLGGREAMFRKKAGPLLPGAEHEPPPGLARRFFGDDDRAADRLADYIDCVIARARALGDLGLAALRSMQDRHPSIHAVRGIGAIFAAELRTPDGGLDPVFVDAVLYAPLRQGLSFKVGAGNVLCLGPPLTISGEDFARAMAALEEALRTAASP